MNLCRWRILPVVLTAPALLFFSLGMLQSEGQGAHFNRQNLPPSVVGNTIKAVASAELQKHVCHLQDDDALGFCNTQGNRYSFNPAGLNEAAHYIASQLAAQGLVTATQSFTLTHLPLDQADTVVLTNVIGSLVGVAPPAERGIILLTAHYDSVTPEASEGRPAPGADDNASGVAALLEAARLLSPLSFWHTIRFVAFAGEEQGLHGSRYHARQAWREGENILAVVNADMIGYEGDNEPRMEVHAGPEAENRRLAAVFTRTVQAYELRLQPQVVVQDPIALSDHAPFWERGFPAILIIEDTHLTGPTNDFNPYYHTPDDTLDKMDIPYFTTMARAIVGTVAHLARPAAPDLRVLQEGPAWVQAGQQVALRMRFENQGPVAATHVVLTHTLSHGLRYHSDSGGFARSFDLAGRTIYDLGLLDSGAAGSLVVTATVLAGLPNQSTTVSRVVIAGEPLDADAADNQVALFLTVRDPLPVYLPLLIGQD